MPGSTLIQYAVQSAGIFVSGQTARMSSMIRQHISTKSMRTSLKFSLRILLPAFGFLSGCSKTEQLPAGTIGEFMPLVTGKYIAYRLDSTVYVNLNTQKVTRSYVVRDWVDGESTDNLGRKTFRIKRMTRSNTDTTRWTETAVFLATPLGKSLEYLDNNLRTIRLMEPIRNDFSWKGNSYINTVTNPQLQYLDGWMFRYVNVGQTFALPAASFPETATVVQHDEVINNPNDKTRFFSVNKSIQVYAKGVGLVSGEFLHETWQPPNISSTSGYYEPNSYGVRLTYLYRN